MQPDVPAICEALRELQVRRKFIIKATIKQTNALGALARSYFGWRYDLLEAERAKIVKRAAKFVSTALNGKEISPEDAVVATVLAGEIDVIAATLAPLDARRKQLEKEMIRLARQLPAHAFGKSVHGFGEKALAIVVGEAGDLANYSCVDKLWKRLGLAPYEGKSASTWRRKGGLSAEEWSAFGYKPARRAEIYAAIDEPLLKHQTIVSGPYRAAYDTRRARTATTHEDWPKSQSHADAMRIMTKKLISDLWSEWSKGQMMDAA